MRSLALVPFVLSGFAALVYEVVWTRALSHLLGGTAGTFAFVLVVFTVGLGIGGLIGGSRLFDRAAPLRSYAALQVLITLFGAVSCDVLASIGGVGRLGLPSFLDTSLRGAISAAFLLVPTLAMGATFPLGCRALVERAESAGHWGGWLSAASSLGAVVGAAGAGLFLVRDLGFRVTAWVAGGASLLAAALALVLSRRSAGILVTPAGSRSSPVMPSPADRAHFGARFAAFVAGFALIALEVLWSREIAFFVEGFTVCISLLVAAALLGLAVGGAAFARLADRQVVPGRLSAVLLVASGAFALGSLAVFEWGGSAIEAMRSRSAAAGAVAQAAGLFAVALVVAFPASAALGGVVPATIRDLAARLRPARAAASFTCANNLGAAVGAASVAALGLSDLGLKRSLFTLACVLLLSGLCLSVAPIRRPALRAALAAAILVPLALFGIVVPLGDPPILSSHVFRGSRGPEHQLVDAAEGSAFAVSVVDNVRTNERFLYTDDFLAAGTGPAYAYMRLSGHLPALIARDPARGIVIGFGSGTTAGSLARHRDVRSIEIAELSREVLRMAPLFSAWNGGVLDDAARVRVTLCDGRRRLDSSDERYDVISLEPLPPYTAGAVGLYSREFYRLARSRLTPGGVLCQWMPLHALRSTHMLHLLAAFTREIPHVSVWYFEQSALFLGALEPWHIDASTLVRRAAEPDVAQDLQAALVDTPAALIGGGFVAADERIRKAIGDDPGLTDDRPITEFYPLYRGTATTFAHDNLVLLWAMRSSPEPYLDLEGLDRDAASAFRASIEAYGRSSGEVLRAKAALALSEYRALVGEAEGSARALAEAMTAFEAARSANREDLAALRGVRETRFRASLARGRAALERGEAGVAVEALREAVDLSPDRDTGHAWLGLAYDQAGREAQAEAELRRALQLYPSSVFALIHLGCLLARTGRQAEGRDLVERALRIESQPDVGPETLGAARRLLRSS